MAVDATEPIVGNMWRWENETAFELVAQSKAMDQSDPQFLENGRGILQEMVEDMAYINIMNIPTTIPTNETYWTNFPKQDNYYAVPYSWWSSAKEMVVNIEPTGVK